MNIPLLLDRTRKINFCSFSLSLFLSLARSRLFRHNVLARLFLLNTKKSLTRFSPSLSLSLSRFYIRNKQASPPSSSSPQQTTLTAASTRKKDKLLLRLLPPCLAEKRCSYLVELLFINQWTRSRRAPSPVSLPLTERRHSKSDHGEFFSLRKKTDEFLLTSRERMIESIDLKGSSLSLCVCH